MVEDPRDAHRSAFLAWASSVPDAAGGAPKPWQGPAAELLAEHYLMDAVLQAMEGESGRMKQGAPLRPAFWGKAMEFIEVFVQECHRRKETHFFPASVHAGLMGEQQEATLHKEHQVAENLTLHLRTRAAEGDWEGVIRVVSMYVYFMRPHMRREEDYLLTPALAGGTGDEQPELLDEFSAVEAAAFGAKGRSYFLELVRELCTSAGAEVALAAD